MPTSPGARRSRVAVFIDGSNLHHRLADCRWPTYVDVAAFAHRLAGSRAVTGIFYYNVPPPRANRPGQIAAQRRYYARIQAMDQVLFRLGYLQERRVGDRSMFEEKGVDVQLAVDMLSGAHRDEYDTAVLVSSDGDFGPLVVAVRVLAKRVEYLYFPVGVRSRALQQACDVARRCRLSWVIQLAGR